MTEYRVYLLDGEGKITWGTWIQADGLDAAIAAVADQNKCQCEIWLGLRRLAIVPARAQPVPAPAEKPIGAAGNEPG